MNKKTTSGAERSFDDIRMLLSNAIDEAEKPSTGYVYTWIADTFPSSVVYNRDRDTLRRSYVIDEKGTVTLGAAENVERVTTYQPVVEMPAFATEFAETDADYVEWTGKIFECGDYPDKGVKFTKKDLVAIAESFQSAPLRIQHMKRSPFHKLFEGYGLTDVKAIDDGAELHGTVRVPKWLNDGFQNVAKKVSLGFDKYKRIAEISLVDIPRISSAELAAAYSAFSGETIELDDDSPAATKPQVKASDKPPAKKEKHMPGKGKGAIAFFKSLVSKLAPDDFTDEQIEAAFAEEDETTPEVKLAPEVQAQFEKMQKQSAAFAARAVTTAATDFATEMIRSQKAFPSQRAELITCFSEALKADGGGEITFAESGSPEEGANCKGLRALFEKMPKHGLTEEQINGRDLGEPTTFEKPRQMTQEDREAYFSATDSGKALLASKESDKS